MKYIIIAMFLSIFSFARAAEVPAGIYKIDSEQSSMSLFKENHELDGILEIREDFSKSTLAFDTQTAAFESVAFKGPAENFEVRGYLTHRGTTREVTLKARYLGNVNELIGKNKIAFSFVDNDLDLKVIATRPTVNTASMYKEVEDIVSY